MTEIANSNEDIRALIYLVRRWRRFIIGGTFAKETCPLCELYYKNHCYGCPIAEHYDARLCALSHGEMMQNHQLADHNSAGPPYKIDKPCAKCHSIAEYAIANLQKMIMKKLSYLDLRASSGYAT